MQNRSLGTHNGTFHADEVTASALLLLFDLIDKDKIYRTRDPQILENCEYVCDVGGVYDYSIKRFDHHQVEYQGPLSSAGMILLYLKEEKIMPDKVYRFYRDCLVHGVDLHDNGQMNLEPGVCTFSHIISNFMPIEYSASGEDLDKAFFKAVDFTYSHLDRMQKRFKYTLSCRRQVEQEMSNSSVCLFFDKSLPWIENFFSLGGETHSARFVIMPSSEHWKLRVIPPSLKERMKIRTPLPEKWAGLHEEDLKQVTGIQGAVFCHKGRFISIWETKEDAMKALELIIKEEEK